METLRYIFFRIVSLRVFNFVLAPTLMLYSAFGGVAWTIGFFLALERVYALIVLLKESVRCYYEDNSPDNIFEESIAMATIFLIAPLFCIFFGVKEAFDFDRQWNEEL